MDFFEKICSFISNFTHSIHSWTTISSNLLAIAFVLCFRYSILDFYATLDGMNNTLSNILITLSAITAYSLIYRSVSAVATFVSNVRNHKKRVASIAQEKALFQKSFLALSKHEIATLKFILHQDTLTAWLPETIAPVILLSKKGIIKPFSNDRKQISQNLFHDEIFPTARLFVPSEWTLDFIYHFPCDFSKKWKKVKPDFSFASLQ